MSRQQNTMLGVWLMIATTFVFAMQDGISRHLASEYNTSMIVMVRYWVFAAFVVALAARKAGGVRAAARSRAPFVQATRGALLALEIIVAVIGFVLLGLVESHAVFAAYPLLVAALSGPVLGESVGWRRWVAIGVGFIGVLIILQPGFGVFRIEALVPALAALMFAVYSLLTRWVSAHDSSSVSFFWTGIVGMVITTGIGAFHWQPMVGLDWAWMALLCLTSIGGHFLLIKAYEVAEASAIQPLAYLHLVFATALGMIVFDEVLRPNVAVGATIVVSAGLFTLWRAHVARRKERHSGVQRPAQTLSASSPKAR